MTTQTTTLPPIDPLGSQVPGAYRDDLVVVRRGAAVRGRRVLGAVRTDHFDLLRHDSRIELVHHVPPERLDDDLAGLLSQELFGPGWLRGIDLFERLFTGIVRSSAADPVDGWLTFYRNTLARIAHAVDHPPAVPASPPPSPGGHGTIADYAPVYAHAESLLAPGSVLELGACFGFLSLRLALAGRDVTASDVSPGTVHLLEAIAPRLDVRLGTAVADAARYPADDGAADTVLVIHLLEHLDPDHGDRVVDEALRLAARRVVVAVPLEPEADETYGHLRTVSLADLDRWGRRTGCRYDVHEHHGGWLVIDR